MLLPGGHFVDHKKALSRFPREIPGFSWLEPPGIFVVLSLTTSIRMAVDFLSRASKSGFSNVHIRRKALMTDASALSCAGDASNPGTTNNPRIRQAKKFSFTNHLSEKFVESSMWTAAKYRRDERSFRKTLEVRCKRTGI